MTRLFCFEMIMLGEVGQRSEARHKYRSVNFYEGLRRIVFTHCDTSSHLLRLEYSSRGQLRSSLVFSRLRHHNPSSGHRYVHPASRAATA